MDPYILFLGTPTKVTLILGNLKIPNPQIRLFVEGSAAAAFRQRRQSADQNYLMNLASCSKTWISSSLGFGDISSI